jgi:biopolymer transport protein ExbB
MRHALLTLLLAALPLASHAWWNESWTQRTRITLNTGAQGVETHEAATGVPLAVRLHSGNFDFVSAKEDGADLRFVAGDDKTPLAFRIEKFDGINELALVWVQLPTLAPGSDKNVVYAYAGNTQATAESNGSGFDAATLAAVHFSDAENAGADIGGTLKTRAPVTPEPNALLAGGARLDGTPLQWPANERVRIAANGAATVSLWLRADDVARGTLLQWGPLAVTLAEGKLAARVAQATATGGELKAATWTHVALTLGGGKATLYVNGASVAQADAATPLIEGELSLGEGLQGAADELQVSGSARSADWLKIAASSQDAEARLIASVKERSADAGEEGNHGYLGILVGNLTMDAWAVIVILGLMFVVAAWVMVSKTMFVIAADKANRGFLARFRVATHDLLHLEGGGVHPGSSLFRLYLAGVRELKKRKVGENGSPPLSGASLDAVKASVDADLVRESHRLNAQMVWLTIAISGGPFLGLLGTVVGVMITFAAIAAAGDVNVNAIAPGIAAALLATVAGLAVAIPALFGYNYLASRIKNISADMQIFVDEFITRVAEDYGAR